MLLHVVAFVEHDVPQNNVEHLQRLRWYVCREPSHEHLQLLQADQVGVLDCNLVLLLPAANMGHMIK